MTEKTSMHHNRQNTKAIPCARLAIYTTHKKISKRGSAKTNRQKTTKRAQQIKKAGCSDHKYCNFNAKKQNFCISSKP